MRSYLIGASASAVAFCALSLGCTPVLAQGDAMLFAGMIGGGWSDYLLPGETAHTNAWLVHGSAVLTVDNPGFNVQANFNNSEVQVPTQSSDTWSYGGDVYWRDYAGSIGIAVNFASAVSTIGGPMRGSTSTQNDYGWFGQWFADPDLTLQLKGGRLDGHYEGLYGDGGFVYYPYHDIALSLTGNYAEAQHIRENVRDADFTVEYLPVHDVPVSLYLGYDFSLVSQLAHTQVSVLQVGLNVYLGGGGRSGTLVDYQRNGTSNWGGAPASVLEFGF